MLRKENIIPLLGSWLREKVLCTIGECERQVLHANLPPHSLDYDKEIMLNVVIDGWLLSNILINTGVEVNVLNLDTWIQMGRPELKPSLNVLYMEKKTKVMPIDILKDVTITI